MMSQPQNSAEYKVSRSKISLILNSPFFATIALHTTWYLDDSIPTACTDGKRVWYSSKFFDKLKQEEVTGVMIHELMHIVYLHHLRRGSRNPKKFNIAADHVINHIIKEAGFTLPEGHLDDPKYHGMTTEQVYNLLPDSDEGEGEDGDGDPGACGGVSDAPTGGNNPSQAEQEASLKELISQAAQVAKKAGKLPAGLERLITEIMEPRIPWREVLSRFLTEINRNDYSFSRANPRFLHTGFCMPSLYNEEIGGIYLHIDTSGSIDQTILNEVASEVLGITAFTRAGFTALYIDHKLQHVQEVEYDFDGQLEAKGGGGTSFKPGWEWMAENDITPTCSLYFTDGYSDDYPETPDHPVLWIIHGGNNSFSPPFGEILHLD